VIRIVNASVGICEKCNAIGGSAAATASAAMTSATIATASVAVVPTEEVAALVYVCLSTNDSQFIPLIRGEILSDVGKIDAVHSYLHASPRAATSMAALTPAASSAIRASPRIGIDSTDTTPFIFTAFNARKSG